MKLNNIKYTVLAVFSLLLLSCEKDYDTVSRLTYFPEIVINGDQTVFIPSGENTYEEKGAVSTENEVEIETTISSNVDTETPGSYTVSYSATNVDGYSKAVTRSVIVYDAVKGLNPDDLSGEYTANVDRNGTESYSGNTVTLKAVEGLVGVYEISDWIGGFYAFGRGYGSPTYDFKGYLQVTASNEVIHLSMSNAWGDPFDSVDNGVFDPATGMISYSASWLKGRYTFVVDMTKN